jgi:hypothetical protein
LFDITRLTDSIIVCADESGAVTRARALIANKGS